MKSLASWLLASSLIVMVADGAARSPPNRRARLRAPSSSRSAPRAGRCRARPHPVSNLLVVNGALYLIDAGDNVTRRIVQAGHDFRKIGKIFITHPHSDHTAGLATLMVASGSISAPSPIESTAAASKRWSKARSLISSRTPKSAGPKASSGRWATPSTATMSRRASSPGRQRQGDGGREYPFQVRGRQSALRQVQVVFLSRRNARPRRRVHRRYRAVGRGDRIGEGRRCARDRGDVGRRSGRADQAHRRLAGEEPDRAGGLDPPHARGARVAGGGRENGDEGRRQDHRDDPFRAVGACRTTTIIATPTRRRNTSRARSWSPRT